MIITYACQAPSTNISTVSGRCESSGSAHTRRGFTGYNRKEQMVQIIQNIFLLLAVLEVRTCLIEVVELIHCCGM